MTARAAAIVVSLSALAGVVMPTVVDARQAAPQVIRVPLEYRRPVTGQPKPNFSPKGMQVALAALPADAVLPDGAARPAKQGAMQLGTSERAWLPVLATSSAACPKDLCRLYVDANRNRNFADDGAPLLAEPKQREKTLDWWTSFDGVEVTVPYATGVEPYLVNFWIVRPNDAAAPDLLRFSVNSWRQGRVAIGGVTALVAAMDDNDAVWNQNDMWSVLEDTAPDAAKAVLSIAEAKATSRLMFVKTASGEKVLEFRSMTPDGRAMEFAVVDRPVTKAEDRKADDALAVERVRPRATTAFTWGPSLPKALAAAKAAGKKVFIDFETDWCGPCHQMDQWIWTDAEVAGLLNAGYVGVKLDGDIEKALVKQYKVAGYPTMVVLDGAGKELWRAVGYQSSAEMLALLRK